MHKNAALAAAFAAVVAIAHRARSSITAHLAAVMIGCFTVKRRVKLRPEVVLWRGVVLALG
jgi:hypothetical protein